MKGKLNIHVLKPRLKKLYSSYTPDAKKIKSEKINNGKNWSSYVQKSIITDPLIQLPNRW